MTRLLTFFVACFFITTNATAQSPLERHDSNTPVSITSDILEILQNKQQAIFTGNVTAKQGDVSLKSDIMQVNYHMKQDAYGSAKNSVSKVTTKGRVHLITPKEQAKSDQGIFDVDNNLITLSGNVRLIQGKNVAKGEKMVYNLTTGKSALTGKKKGRIRGFFMPNG